MRRMGLGMLAVAVCAALPASGSNRFGERIERNVPLDGIVRRISELVRAEKDRPSVAWLIDPSPVYAESSLPDRLGSAVAAAFEGADASHLVVAFGAPARTLVKPTRDLKAVTSAFRSAAEGGGDETLRCMTQNLRDALKAMGGGKGPKFVVLFTQSNADSEDDVEATAALLRRSNARLLAVVPETSLSDSWWAATLSERHRWLAPPEPFRKLGFRLAGPEAPYAEFPYGWPFRAWVDPTLTAPAGYAPWAVQRLVDQSGGACFLLNARPSRGSFCRRYWGACLVCRGTRRACGFPFDETKLRMTAPSSASRSEYLAQASGDRLLLEMLDVWEMLYRGSILMGPPPLLAKGGRLVEAPDRKANRGGGETGTTVVETPKKGTRRQPGSTAPAVVIRRRAFGTDGDNSNSQYAALALRACYDAGIGIPEDVIDLAVKWWESSQSDDGGWSYGGNGTPAKRDGYGSMTAGALGALAIFDHMKGKKLAQIQRDRTMQRGLKWVEQNFTVFRNPLHADPLKHHFYYLYAIERAGMLLGADRFGPHEWYPVGAKYLLKDPQQDGSWEKDHGAVIDTCFAILFLRRSTSRRGR